MTNKTDTAVFTAILITIIAVGILTYLYATQLQPPQEQPETETFTLGETICQTQNYRYIFHGVQHLWVLGSNYNDVLMIGQFYIGTGSQSDMRLTIHAGDLLHLENQTFRIVSYSPDSITLEAQP